MASSSRPLATSLRRAGASVRVHERHATHPSGKEGVAAVHAACRDMGGSGALHVCAGCCVFMAVRLRGSGAQAGDLWLVAMEVRAGAGVLERHLRNEEGDGIHGSMTMCMGR